VTQRDWQCLRKIRYDSPALAARAIPRLKYPELRPMNVYRCPHCKLWHIGRKGKLRRSYE
jgi:hypothetical protein